MLGLSMLTLRRLVHAFVQLVQSSARHGSCTICTFRTGLSSAPHACHQHAFNTYAMTCFSCCGVANHCVLSPPLRWLWLLQSVQTVVAVA